MGVLSNVGRADFSKVISTSADSGPEKPENPNLETETRQTRTRKIVKIPKPDKPEPENETRGYPMYFYRQKTGKIKLFKLCRITY